MSKRGLLDQSSGLNCQKDATFSKRARQGLRIMSRQDVNSCLLLKRFQPLAGVAQLVGASPHRPKVCRFDSGSGHIPRLQVQLPVRVPTRSNHQCFSILSLSLSLSLSLPPTPFCLPENNENMSFSEHK